MTFSNDKLTCSDITIYLLLINVSMHCTIDMHIRYSFVKQNYSDVLKNLYRYSYGTQKRSPIRAKKLLVGKLFLTVR